MFKSSIGESIMLLFLIGCCLGACNRSPEANQETPLNRRPYQTVRVKREAIRFPIRCSGTLALEQEIVLSFKIGGIIQQMYAEKGDRVNQGQVLAALNRNELNERYRQAQDNYERLQSTLERTENLYEQNIGTFQNLEELRSAAEIAQSNLNIAANSLQDANLVAPSSGIIIEKYQESGEIASPGKPVYRISGQGARYVFQAALSDDQVVKVRQGDSAVIQLSAYPAQPIYGKVSNVYTSPDANTSLYPIEISFSNLGLALKPGFIGDALIFGTQSQIYALIPPEALVEASAFEATVYISGKDQVLLPRKVKIAHILDNAIAISEGLEGISEVIIP